MLKSKTNNQYEALQVDYKELTNKFNMKFHKCIPLDKDMLATLCSSEFNDSLKNDEGKELQIKSISLDFKMFTYFK